MFSNNNQLNNYEQLFSVFCRFDFYERLKDVQTLAIMSCLLAKQPLPEYVQEFSKIHKIEEEEKVKGIF